MHGDCVYSQHDDQVRYVRQQDNDLVAFERPNTKPDAINGMKAEAGFAITQWTTLNLTFELHV